MKKEVNKIEVAPHKKVMFLLRRGDSYEIIAENKSREKRVVITPMGEHSQDEFAWQAENKNDSEVFIHIYRIVV